jgi:hypothetical protein
VKTLAIGKFVKRRPLAAAYLVRSVAAARKTSYTRLARKFSHTLSRAGLQEIGEFGMKQEIRFMYPDLTSCRHASPALRSETPFTP